MASKYLIYNTLFGDKPWYVQKRVGIWPFFVYQDAFWHNNYFRTKEEAMKEIDVVRKETKERKERYKKLEKARKKTMFWY